MNPVRQPIRDITFSIREISEKAAAMDDVVRLDIGQPDFETPGVVTERMADIVQGQNATYTSLWGIDDLRSEIAAFESRKASYDAEHVMVSTGGIGALYCILDALLDTGDTALTNDPSWSPYRLIAAATPGTVQQTPYIDSEGQVREQAIRDAIDSTTNALILNTPENPTGHVYTEDQIQHLGEIAEDEDLYIIADEVYDQLVYDGTHCSPAEYVPDRTIVVNSLSKNFAMTGWRLGWAAATDTDLIHELGKVNRATTACPNYMSQQAALVALQHAQGYPTKMREVYRERRDLVMDRVAELGWDCRTPQGAIYAFPDVGQDSWVFARSLLDETGVAVVPGEPAGPSSDTHIRICFGSVDKEQLADGFDRIAAYTG